MTLSASASPPDSGAPDRCIPCEELELARVRDERPSQTLPLPVSALEGLPEGRDSGSLTRRRLLQGGVAGFAAVYGSRALGFEEVFEAAVAQAVPSGQNRLVVLYLAGGNDSLNCVLPGTAAPDLAAYRTARPTIWRRPNAASAAGAVGSRDIAGTSSRLAWANPLVSTAGGGDNGSAYGLDTLYGDGGGGPGSDLAFLPAADYTPSNFSHFDSSDYWFAGGLASLTTGWLGRWIDRNGSATNPLQAVSIDTALSKAIRTAVNPVCAIPSVSALGFTMNAGSYGMPPGAPSTANINTEMRELAAVTTSADNTYLRRSRSTYGLAVDVAGSGATIGGLANATEAYPTGGSAQTLSTKLQLTAKLLAAGLGTRIVTVHWGGFDTHGTQVATQDPQLRAVSAALGAFKADLTARGIEQNVTTLVFSEFGRRAGENGSMGTDHGAGGLMLLSGSAVRGGWAGEFPGCAPANLVGGNLKVTTDFRSVYQSVLSEWLGGDTTGVLPDGTPAPIVRADGGSTLFR